MELFKYTLQQVSYAIVDPYYSLILIIMGFMFYFKNKKTVMMEKMIMGKNTYSAFELTISQIVMGIFGGVIASIILTYLGISFFETSNIYLIFIISIALMFFNPKLVCFSYSGAILGLISSMMYFLSMVLERPQINVLKIDITNILILVGVMHIVEGLLVIIDGKRGAIPVFAGRDKKIIGGFAYRRQWILPMIILLMVQAGDTSIGSGSVNVPQWWPIINHDGNLKLLTTMAVGALPIFAGLNYSTVTFTKSKEEKPVFSGVLILGYGLLIGAMSLLGNINPFLDLALLLLMPIFHEYMLYFDRNSEKKGKIKYVSNEEGLCVLDVAPNSLAKAMGLQRGDLILEINNIKVDRDEIVYNALENLPRTISIKVKKANGVVKDLLSQVSDNRDKLGFIIVPRKMPGNVTVAKGSDSSFEDILKKVKEKKDKKDNK